MSIVYAKTLPGTPDAGYRPEDDLRHRPGPGQRMRDSLFWQLSMPDEKLGFQAYLYLAGDGRAGFNVVVWDDSPKPLVFDLGQATVGDQMDLDDFSLKGLSLTQERLRQSACLNYESDNIRVHYDFNGLHDAFSYHQNPDGLPSWFAMNRLEQTGWVKGFLEFGDRRIELDRVGHRDHSWGPRRWGMPQHWKWLIAYSDDGQYMVNAWIWIAKGEWGVGGYVVKGQVLLPISHIKHHATYDDDMGQQSLEAEIFDTAGGRTTLDMRRIGLVHLPSSDKAETLVSEAVCEAEIDGVKAGGQFETHWSKTYLNYLKGLKG